MSRIETIGNATLYLGDCREILPALQIETVVTDPPYGIDLDTDNSRFSGGHTASIARRGNGPGPSNGRPLIGDDEPFDPKPFLLGKEQIIWGWHNFPDRLPRGSCLIWIKRLEKAFGSFLSDAETAWFSKGHGVYCFRDLSTYAEAKTRKHPTQKPIPLMKWCVQKTKGTVIVDPFMGSASTGIAALMLGRKFVGIEIDPSHFDVACRRIEAAVNQPDLFIESQDEQRQLAWDDMWSRPFYPQDRDGKAGKDHTP